MKGNSQGKVTKEALETPWNTMKTVINKWRKYGTKVIQDTRRKLFREAAKRPTATLTELREFRTSTGCVKRLMTIFHIHICIYNMGKGGNMEAFP